MPRSVLAMTSRGVLIVALLVAGTQSARAQRGGGGGGRGQGGGGGGAAPQRDTTTGFAIRDKATITACGECHLRDSSGYMQRISYERKTPEGWEMSVRRMVSLNNVALDPATARTIVRYLSDQQGLAPAELRPGRFETERRMIEYRYTADTRTETHVPRLPFDGPRHHAAPNARRMGAARRDASRALSRTRTSRRFGAAVRRRTTAACRTRTRWTSRSRISRACSRCARPSGPRGRRRCGRRISKERGCCRDPSPGAARSIGQLTVTRGATDGEFLTKANYRYADGGAAVQRNGKSIVYTGYQWRGRSTEPRSARQGYGRTARGDVRRARLGGDVRPLVHRRL